MNMKVAISWVLKKLGFCCEEAGSKVCQRSITPAEAAPSEKVAAPKSAAPKAEVKSIKAAPKKASSPRKKP